MTSSDGKEWVAPRGSKSSASDTAHAWDAALRWLGRRDRTAREIADYLVRRGFSDAVVTDVTTRLRDEGYVDDFRLATERAEYWCRRGYGRLRARAELLQRGVAASVIAAALDPVFADEDNRARQLVEQRFPAAQRDARMQARAYRFLVARGFPEEVVVVIVGEPC